MELDILINKFIMIRLLFITCIIKDFEHLAWLYLSDQTSLPSEDFVFQSGSPAGSCELESRKFL